ncbi:MAG: M23 family metallopeptidase [Bacteroidota bacterium]
MKRKIDWWIYTVPILLVITFTCYFIVLSRPGLTGVILFYLAPLLISFLAIIFLLIGIILSLIRRPVFNPWRIAGFTGLILLCFSGIIYNTYPSSYDDKPSKVQFRLPLDTAISVAWGGAEECVNYHVIAPDQRWAYDLMIIKDDRTFTGDSSKLENYFCYGLDVVAPAAGKVVTVFDSDPDMEPGVLGGGTLPVGNHIVIEVAPKEYLFICHLQPKSIKVKTGDQVQQGQLLGLVGNSGNTSEPHVHIHLQDTKIQSLGEGIPLYFHHYSVNGKYVERGIPTGGIGDDGKFIGQTVKNVSMD